jgi:hypothetical protein
MPPEGLTMGKLAAFVLDNLNRLQPIDYVVIVILVSMAAVGIFSVFRWIYSAVLKAKAELVQTKEETIAAYKRNLRLAERERESVERQYSNLSGQLEALEAAYRKADFDKAVLAEAYRHSHLNALILAAIATKLYLFHNLLGMVGNAKDYLILYQGIGINVRFPEAPDPIELHDAINRIEGMFDDPLGAMRTILQSLPRDIDSEAMSLPVEALHFDADSLREATLVVVNRMRPHLNRVFKKPSETIDEEPAG